VPGYDLGFRSLSEEVEGYDLPVEGRFPEWLSGRYVRNGPGLFEINGERLGHWFDGLAMLTAFSFSDSVTYTNRFLRTRTYRDALAGESIGGAFAESSDGVFGRLRTLLAGNPTDNANANVIQLNGRFAAITESPVAVVIDPETLATEGILEYDDGVEAQHTTAHPVRDAKRGESVGYGTRFGLRHRYEVYRIPDGSTERKLIGSVPVNEPAYMHSFAVTERYVVLTENPFTANPLRFLHPKKSFIDAYEWHPERGTRFVVLDRLTGEVITTPRVPAFFTFHHANAFERETTGDDSDDGGEIVIDLVAYENAAVLDGLYLDDLGSSRSDASTGELRRYCVPLDGGQVTRRTLADIGIEFPRVSPAVATAMEPHRYVYGQGDADDDRNANELVKVDTETGTVQTWTERGIYAGEPAFVPAPESKREDATMAQGEADREDDGIVLSILLDTNAKQSALLALDGQSFEERARATVPHPIPFGFHGQYFPEE
jgi:beta,beta-carotene 9',10'-dioxygenase